MWRVDFGISNIVVDVYLRKWNKISVNAMNSNEILPVWSATQGFFFYTVYSFVRLMENVIMDVGATISSIKPALRRAAFQSSRSDSRNSMLSFAVFNESSDSLSFPPRSRPATPVSFLKIYKSVSIAFHLTWSYCKFNWMIRIQSRLFNIQMFLRSYFFVSMDKPREFMNSTQNNRVCQV